MLIHAFGMFFITFLTFGSLLCMFFRGLRTKNMGLNRQTRVIVDHKRSPDDLLKGLLSGAFFFTGTSNAHLR